ncbi:MAG: peptidoglycan bridge formation glycyltransferase FemA/FemB family protein [Bacteroidota bacterium]
MDIIDYKVLTKFSEIDKPEWSAFITNHPQGTVFQTPQMIEFYQVSQNLEPVVVACYDLHNHLAGIMVAVIQKEHDGFVGSFSARSIIWGGPLVKNNEPALITLLLRHYDQIIKKKAVFSQFRNFYDVLPLINVYTEMGYRYEDWLNLLVETVDEEETFKSISKSKRRQIKKGKSGNVQLVEPESLDDVREFYEILKSLYRLKVKKPLPSWSFFENFYHFSKEGKLGKYLMIKNNGKVIGGIMCAITPYKTIYEWYITGMDIAYKDLYPSVMATYFAIDYALKNKLSFLNFMGAGSPNEAYGVREFKTKFGGELVNYGRFTKIHRPFIMSVSRLLFYFWANRKLST